MIIEQSKQIISEINRAFIGKNEVIEKVLMTIYAGGHVLLEDCPGVGKTTLAVAFSRVLGLSTRRIQFTPDTLPSDITGFTMWNRKTGEFEYRDGAAVCLISESLSRESGLNVGDTLPLSLYEFDQDLLYSYLTEYNPRSSLYLPDRGFQQETEYTVIGLYRQSSEWVTTPTSFTPNSVFVPEKSVTCQTVSGDYGVWETMILKNGTAGQMEARLKENGLGGVVTYYDQGYSEIVESLDGFSRVSRTVLWVGLALWVVVLAAYCVLFPLQEGKTALRMWTLGTVKRDITGSIWLSSAAVAVIGTVIALAVSIPGMSWAIGKLKELTGSELTMSVSPWQTAALCAVVLVLELAAVALCSALAARRGIRKAA